MTDAATQPANLIPTPDELGFDPEALRKRYAAERAKRLRTDANDQYQVPPKSPAFSTIRSLVMPASCSRTAANWPPKPPPMTSTSISSRNGGRVKGSTYGSTL